MKKISLSIFILLIACLFAQEAEKPKYPVIKPTATMFLYYRYDLDTLSTPKGYNKFDVSRAYLGVKVDISEKFKAQVVYDAYDGSRLNDIGKSGKIDTIKPGDTIVDVKSSVVNGFVMGVLKNAFLQCTPSKIAGLSAEIGLLNLPWVPYDEKIWKFRFVEKSFADAEGLMTSTDLGARVRYIAHIIPAEGKMPLNPVDIDAALVNGEGWNKPVEPNKFKDVHLRLTLSPPVEGPLSGLKLTGFYATGKKDENFEKNRLVGQLSFEYSLLTLGLQCLTAKDSTKKSLGFSANTVLDFGKLMTKKSFGIFGRYDHFDTHTGLPEAEQKHSSRIIIGLFKEHAKGVRCALNYQSRTLEYLTGDKSWGALFLNLLVGI